MGFKPKMVDAVIDSLFEPQPVESLDQSCNEATNREFPRTPFRGRAPAVIFPPPSTPNGEPIESEVLTTDISRGGLSLLHQSELFPGQQVLLQLSQGSRTVEVCWCCEVWTGLYIAGCRFADVIFADSAG